MYLYENSDTTIVTDIAAMNLVHEPTYAPQITEIGQLHR